jgi:hypothetical protein
MFETPSLIELLRVHLVAAFYLAVDLGASGRDAAVRNAEIRKVPSELRGERRVIVRLDFVDGEGKMLADFP